MYLFPTARGQGEVHVELRGARFVPRGGSTTLRCEHSVPPHLLYKVEFLRGGHKLVQYVRERRPPYTSHPITGAVINMTLVTPNSITLEELDFTASGIYSCEVSLETPIYTKASNYHELTVIQPQKHPPRIKFNAMVFTTVDVLRANCTSAPAHPAPHITWFINHEKVDESLTRPYVTKHHRNSNAISHVSTTELAVPVTKLPVSEPWLEISCVSTIPSYVAPGEQYADMKRTTVKVDVNIEAKPTQMSAIASSGQTKLERLTEPLYIVFCMAIIRLLLRCCCENI